MQRPRQALYLYVHIYVRVRLRAIVYACEARISLQRPSALLAGGTSTDSRSVRKRERERCRSALMCQQRANSRISITLVVGRREGERERDKAQCARSSDRAVVIAVLMLLPQATREQHSTAVAFIPPVNVSLSSSPVLFIHPQARG